MKFKNYWKTLLIAALILTANIMSGKQLNKVQLFEIKYFDKIIHFTMYFVLVLSIFSSYLKSFTVVSKENKIVIILVAASYGLLMEGFQLFFTTDRSAEVADVIANTIGCVSGLFLYPILFRYKIFRLL